MSASVNSLGAQNATLTYSGDGGCSNNPDSRGGKMATNTVTNWFGNIVSHPSVIVEANSVDDIVAVMKDPVKYPSPVRAVGSNHSTAPCGVADGGTLIRMKMNRILNIGTDSLTVKADAVHLTWRRRSRPGTCSFT